MFEYYISDSPVDFFGYMTTDRSRAIAAIKNGEYVEVTMYSDRHPVEDAVAKVFDNLLGL